MAELTEEKDILLAEDDMEDVQIFQAAMGELDIPHILRHAHNGESLFILLGDRVPHILFLDIDMPCKDGMACIKEIRQNKAYDHLPVIMYTSHLHEKIIEESFRNGANLFLTKAHTFNELVGKMRKIFDIDWKNYMHYPSRGNFVVN